VDTATEGGHSPAEEGNTTSAEGRSLAKEGHSAAQEGHNSVEEANTASRVGHTEKPVACTKTWVAHTASSEGDTASRGGERATKVARTKSSEGDNATGRAVSPPELLVHATEVGVFATEVFVSPPSGASFPDCGALSPPRRLVRPPVDSGGPSPPCAPPNSEGLLPAQGGAHPPWGARVPPARAQPVSWLAADRPLPAPPGRESLQATLKKREFLVETASPFANWALAEHLAHSAIDGKEVSSPLRALGDQLDRARLAVQIADAVSGPEAWKSRVRGYTQGYFARTLREAGKEEAAGQPEIEVDRMWTEGVDQEGRSEYTSFVEEGRPRRSLERWRLFHCCYVSRRNGCSTEDSMYRRANTRIAAA